MSRIAKKSRSVKGAKPSKHVKPPRYTIRKDSLDRRYAIDKHTGKRVSVSKATEERVRRRKAAQKEHEIFRGIQLKPAPKAAKVKIQRLKRSEAAKRGWETRRAKAIPFMVLQPPLGIVEAPPPSPPIVFEGRPPSFGELIGPLIPEWAKMQVAGGIADRANIYPKVQKAADRAWINLQVEAFAQQRAIGAKQEPEPIITPRFDRLYGEGHGAHVRFNYYARATDLSDIDQMVETLVENEDNDYEARELYTLYFSPEVA